MADGRTSAASGVLPGIEGLPPDWCAKEGLDGVVWTDLPPNFKDQTGKEYTVATAVAYLEGLPKTGGENALQYIGNAPDEVNTPLRRALEGLGLLAR